MVVFYQTRSHHHKTIDLPVQTCKTCGNRGTFKMHLFQKYVWIFGPFFPSNKYAIIECAVCKIKLPRNEWTKDLDAIYQKEIQEIKTPFRLWRGAIAFSTVTVIFLSFQQLGYLKPAANLNDPVSYNNTDKIDVEHFKENDILLIDIYAKSKTEYSTLAKVIKIEGEKTTLKKYSEKFNFTELLDYELSDVDNSNFKDVIEVRTSSIRKYGNLFYATDEISNLNIHPFGIVHNVIKN